MTLVRLVAVAVLAVVFLLLVPGQVPSVGAGHQEGSATLNFKQDRQPKCCGQCTTSDNKSGCTIKRTDGTSFCSAC